MCSYDNSTHSDESQYSGSNANLSHRFSPHYENSSSVDFQSADESHTQKPSLRSVSPFALQGQVFSASVSSSLSRPRSQASMDSRSSSSHNHRRHRHDKQNHTDTSPFAHRPRTPSPTSSTHLAPYEQPSIDQVSYERPYTPSSTITLSTDASLGQPQQQPPQLSQNSRQSSYIVSICTNFEVLHGLCKHIEQRCH